MRHWISLLALVVFLDGCSSTTSGVAASSGTGLAVGERTELVRGLRTDPDHRGLVASYIGGACDGPARLALAETATRIDVAVAIGPDPHGSGTCTMNGITRSVAARLAAPVGERWIWTDGQRVVPFDGARLLVPAALPEGFVRGGEIGEQPPGEASTGGLPTTTRWSVGYGAPVPEATDGHCTGTRGSFTLTFAPSTASDFTGWVAGPSSTIGSATGQLWRTGGGGRQNGAAYSWPAMGGVVEIISQQGCDRDQVAGPGDLLRIARSLRPAT